MENSRICDICYVIVHRASYAKHLRSEKHLENIKQDEIIIVQWLFKGEQTPLKIKSKKTYSRKTLKQIAIEKILLDQNELQKELAIKTINP